MNKTSKTITPEDKLDRILQLLEEQKKERTSSNGGNEFRVYDNKSLKSLLGIGDKLLKYLRDNGYIDYQHLGDKFWYTQAQVEAFFKRCHFRAFAQGNTIPGMEGGWS